MDDTHNKAPIPGERTRPFAALSSLTLQKSHYEQKPAGTYDVSGDTK